MIASYLKSNQEWPDSILRGIKVALMSYEDEIARSSMATLQIDAEKVIECDEEEFKLPFVSLAANSEHMMTLVHAKDKRHQQHKIGTVEDDATSICRKSAAGGVGRSYSDEENDLVLNSVSEMCSTEIEYVQSPLKTS